jgi:hypothetical protein
MNKSRLERYAPLAGVVFFVILVAAIIVSGSDTPDNDDPTLKVVAYWSKHDSDQIVSSLLAVYAVAALVWFAASVRSAIATVERGANRLATLSFAGSVILAVGLATSAAFSFVAADTVGDVPPTVTQTFSVLNNDFFFPISLGVALMLGAAGVAALRYAWLPAWAGWVSLLIAVAAVTPVGFFAILAAAIWVLVVSVVLFRRESAAAANTPAAGSPPAPATGMAG